MPAATYATLMPARRCHAAAVAAHFAYAIITPRLYIDVADATISVMALRCQPY